MDSCCTTVTNKETASSVGSSLFLLQDLELPTHTYKKQILLDIDIIFQYPYLTRLGLSTSKVYTRRHDVYIQNEKESKN